MPWEIRKDLHLDIRAAYGRVLLTSATDSSLLQPQPDFVHGDKMPVRIHFWERGANGTLTAADPGADTTIIFSARPNNIPADSDLLFLSNDFSEIADGVWEGDLDLATQELADHLDLAPAGAKLILGEIEIRDATGTVKRLSLQFPLTARPQAYDNQDAPTALPSPEEWLNARAARYQVLDHAPYDVDNQILTVSGTLGYSGTPITGLPAVLEGTPGGWISGGAGDWTVNHTAGSLFHNPTGAQWEQSPPGEYNPNSTWAPVAPATGIPTVASSGPKTTGQFALYNGVMYQNVVEDSYTAWLIVATGEEVALKANRDGGNTFSGLQTITGQLQLTGQAATDGNSALTRTLSDIERMRAVSQVRYLNTMAFTFNFVGGSGFTNVDGAGLTGGVVVSAYTRMAMTRAWGNFTGLSGVNNACNIPVAFALSGLIQGGTDINNCARFVVGDAGSGAPAAPSANAISARGFGFEIYWSVANARNEIRLFSHDGTTYSVSSGIAFASNSQVQSSIIISSDGAGVSKLFLFQASANGSATRLTSTAAITHTAPSAGNYGQPYASLLISNGASVPATGINIRIHQALIHTGYTAF